MRSITYSALEQGVASTAGIDPTNLLAHEKIMIAEYINDGIRFCWDYYPWAEFTVTEERYFREEWNAQTSYQTGDEVYYNGKYWRLWNLSSSGAPESGAEWHEIGDFYEDSEWSETGLYKQGARVIYNDKTYLCIAELNGNTATGLQQVNYEWDNIDPTNQSYFREIDTQFARYIAYEQTGKNTIGTVLSVHTADPRYNDTQPLNWREGAEGIYVATLNEDQNSLWVRYRKEAPTFTSSSSNEEVPNFLVPAIKAYAYRGWLIGSGQNEKAQLQDIHGLDLLVREIDKLNNQQDRAQPYSIPSEPYRRINARGNQIVKETKQQIGGIKEAFGDITFNLKSSVNGRGLNLSKKGTASSSFGISVSGNGKSAVRFGSVNIIKPIVFTSIIGGGSSTVEGSANITFGITTGKAHQGIPTGEIRGFSMARILSQISINATIIGSKELQRDASSSFGISTIVEGKNIVKRGTGNSLVSTSISLVPIDWDNSNTNWEDTLQSWDHAFRIRPVKPDAPTNFDANLLIEPPINFTVSVPPKKPEVITAVTTPKEPQLIEAFIPFVVSIIEEEQTILSMSGDTEAGTVAYGTDTKRLYVFNETGLDAWGAFTNDDLLRTSAYVPMNSARFYGTSSSSYGISGNINRLNSGTWTRESPVTMSGFFKVYSFSGDPSPFGTAGSMATDNWNPAYSSSSDGLSFNSTGRANIQFGNGQRWLSKDSTNLYLSLNTWYHFAWTFDGAMIRCWLNGEEVFPNTSAFTQRGATIPQVYLSQGRWNQSIDGLVDQVALWDSVLDDTAIQAIASGDRNTSLTYNPLAFYAMDNEVDERVPDTSGNSQSDLSLVLASQLDANLVDEEPN